MKRLSLIVVLAVLSCPALPAAADDGTAALRALPQLPAGMIHPYDPGQFAKAQADGKRVMVIFNSRYSPASQERQPVLDRLSHDYLYPDVVFFMVDGDRRPELLREFRADNDSVIVFHGTQERGRSGDVGEMELRHLLDGAR